MSLPATRVWCHQCGHNELKEQVPHPELNCPACGTLIAKQNALDPLTQWDTRFGWSHGFLTLTCSNCHDTRFARAPLISDAEVRCKSCNGTISWRETIIQGV